MIIFSSANTTPGMVRTENQDAFGCCKESNLFFVCDGMGGAIAGDFASKYAVEVILKSYSKIDSKKIYSIVGEEFSKFNEYVLKPIACIKLANRALHNLTLNYPKLSGMGTTCTAVWFERATSLMHIYNVGDSRVYRIRNGSIRQLTEDHSKIQELLDSGKMTQADVKTAEIQSMITRALGIADTVKVDYKAEVVKDGDIFVLCSDGLNGELTDWTINDIVNLHKPGVDSISKELIISANNAGGKDNTTVIALYAQNKDNDNVVTPDDYQENIITCKNETYKESSAEDSFIKKIKNSITLKVPQLAKEKKLLKNPLIIAMLIVLLGVGAMLGYLNLFNGQNKSIEELTGNVSGLQIEVRTLTKEKLDELKHYDDKVTKMQLLQECIGDLENCTVAISNVEILIESNNQNVYMGLSSYIPIDVNLPTGQYTVTLVYPNYKVLNSKYELKNSIDVYLENANSLLQRTFIMLPENIGDKNE